MRKSKLDMTTILFFGALWGFLEATLGYILHFIPALVSGLIMFPIASMIMIKAYQVLRKRNYLIYIGFIAAAIKSVDFLLPGLPLIKTLSPIIAIIIEAMVVAAAYTLFEKRTSYKGILGSLVTSIAWRAVFVIYTFGVYLFSGNLAVYLATPEKVLNFVVISGAYSSMILIGLLQVDRLISIKLKQAPLNRKLAIRPSYGAILLILAVGVQYLL